MVGFNQANETTCDRRFRPYSLVTVILLLSSISIPAGSQDFEVRVGIYENRPKVFTSTSGEPQGIFVDIIEEIAAAEGWQLRYVPGTWREGLERLSGGEIDLMVDVAHTADRERRFSFHQEPVLYSWFQVYCAKGSGISSILDLDGKRITVLEDSVQQDVFSELAVDYGLATHLIPRPNYEAAFRTVANGDADAVITNNYYGAIHFKDYGLEDTAVLFSPTSLFYAAPKNKGQDLIDAIDVNLRTLKADTHSVYYKSLKRWAADDVAFAYPAWLRPAAGAAVIVLLMSLMGAALLKRQVNVRTKALSQSELKYRQLVQHANSIILQWTRDGRVAFLNEFGQKFFGYTEGEIVGCHVVGTIVPETESTGRDLRPLMDEICANPRAFEHNVNENMRRNGERVWVAWANKVDFDDRGQVEGILSIGTDITEQRRAESALRDSEVRYRGLFEDCPTSVWEEDFSRVKEYIDALRRSGISDLEVYFDTHPEELRECAEMIEVLDVNRATLEMLQYEHREDLCAHLSVVFREDSYPTFRKELICLASGNTLFQTEATNHTRDGEKLNVNMTVAIVPGHEDDWSRVFVTLTDISQRVRAEDELRRLNAELESRVKARTAELKLAKDRAESADRTKSNFLAAMSHELRTPLNSIIGFTGILSQGLAGPINPEQDKQLRMVQGSARHLLALINDVLDLSKIEAGQLEVKSAPFHADESVEKVVRLAGPLADKKGLTLSSSVSPEVGEISSDSRRFEQILINLVNNAIKFTKEGYVRVECAVQGDKLVTRVMDSGIGIKPEDLDKLYQSFQQIDSGLTRNHEGSGLGLSISKKLAAKLGGEISAESQWGKGSTFTFTLPIRPE